MNDQALWAMQKAIIVLIFSASCSVFTSGANASEIASLTVPKNVVVCHNATLVCQVRPPNTVVWWSQDDKNITLDAKRWSTETFHDEAEDVANVSLHIVCVQFADAGNYTCHALDPAARESGAESEPPVVRQSRFLNVVIPAEVVSHKSARVKVHKEAVLECGIKGYPLRDVHWQKAHDIISISDLKNMTQIEYSNDSYAYTKLKFDSVNRKDNGTYYCKGDGPLGTTEAAVPLFVLDVPQLNFDFVKAVGSRRIFLNWTANDWNEPVIEYFIQHMKMEKNSTPQWTYYQEQIGGGNTSYVLQNLEPNTPYKFRLNARNSIGQSNTYETQEWVTTLETDPNFTPEITVEGLTSNSISIQWSSPPPAVKEHVHYYHLHLSNNNTVKKEAIQAAKNQMNVFLFGGLKPNTEYQFKVAACSDFTKLCGNWSKTVEGRTSDGTSSAPENVTISCKFDNVSLATFVKVTWAPPLQPNGEIVHYNVQLVGKATFLNERGTEETLTLGPKVKRIDANPTVKRIDAKLSALFGMVASNTNYTVTISAVTRARNEGIEARAQCFTPPTAPEKEKLKLINWSKVEENGQWMFKLFLPRISERNGPICCYRVYVVKLPPHQGVEDLPTPDEFPLSSFFEVKQSPLGGAYMAEMFENVPANTEVIVGDGRSVERNTSGACQRCVVHRRRAVYVTPTTPTTTSTSTSTTSPPDVTAPLAYIPSLMSTTAAPLKLGDEPPPSFYLRDYVPLEAVLQGVVVRRRRAENAEPLMPFPTAVASVTTAPPPTEPSTEAPVPTTATVTVACDSDEKENCSLPVYDGALDMNYNYTGFLEVIVMGSQSEILTAHSKYFVVLNPGPQVLQADDSTAALIIALQVLCALMLVVLLLLATLCLLQRYNKQVAESQGVELSIRTSFRHLYRSLRGRQVMVPAQPPDMPPISAADLPSAYAERHKDSDYGFQHEFELLPVRFPDRTTNASECNIYKNRYPDIKAYDQTRVKLAQVDSIVGSDYINANFVVGYKERKKFICAQGPMENTLSDFWRMIWEQHLEMVLMLTNLEEYSKTKCAKYWPDTGESKTYGDISVTHVSEKRESEFILRELSMTRSSGTENRKIIQYHFLVWKDFQAPEHPAGILKYIKRVNEAYSLEKGPILIHCSAGVGRTGTLVALDSLLQQLAEERQVTIFNTVCDLRHQRNFLVQSLKQYIFVYRTLVEMAQFGDTELTLSKLKSSVEWLRQRDNGQTKTRMEEEFEKISGALEEQKSTSVGSADENSGKNRSEAVIPYDRNRVILTPIPGKEHSTYINASFIEGYDNSESFIITQDPLEGTVADFWRMLSEQCVSTLVMLTDVSRPGGLRSQQSSGDSAKESGSPQAEAEQVGADMSRKCLRYWPEPDDETTYDHIRVRYIQSESCPYYTRREFNVINTKNDDNTMVTQFHYHGWPTVEGEVPEVTRGLIELVDQSQSNQSAQSSSGPIVVHCGCGSERSSMFVALSILVQQLRTEKRVDVCTTTRKLRSQRQGMIKAFAQYEFLHRAIINYADLHNLAEETTST